MDEGVRVRRRIETGLSQAIARDELALVYQPIVAQSVFEVVGFEALLRWNHPKLGLLGPGQFLGAAARIREDARRRQEAAAAKAGVMLVVPLGLLFLPAFVCTAVVPVVAALAGRALSGS